MKYAVVTGASSGIGRSIAIELSANNYYVFLVGRNQQRLDETLDLLPLSNQAITIVADLAEEEGCSKAVQQIIDHLPGGQLTALVNNAGVFLRKDFQGTTEEDWISQINTNLLSVVRMTRGLYSYLVNTENSSIVNISSSLALRSVASTAAYSSVKAALISLTETLALEFAPSVRVNCIAPGMVSTPIHDFYQSTDKDLLQQMDRLQPMGRVGKANEIAKAVAYLVGEDSAWTTGTTLKIDGGISL